MKLLMAAYDPSQKGQNGYWSWTHADLPADLPALFYEMLSSDDKPSAAAEILQLQNPENRRGGCLAIDDDWGCVYRFFYGGLDRSLRQSFVLVAGFAPRKDLGRCNWLTPMLSGRWSEFLHRGDKGPLLPPPDDSWALVEATSVPDPKQARQARDTGRLYSAGEAGIRSVADVTSGELVGRNSFHCRIRLFPPTDLSAELSVEKKPLLSFANRQVGTARAEEIIYEPSNSSREGHPGFQAPTVAARRPDATAWEADNSYHHRDDDRPERIIPFDQGIFDRVKNVAVIAGAILVGIATSSVVIYSRNHDAQRSQEPDRGTSSGSMSIPPRSGARPSPSGPRSNPDPHQGQWSEPSDKITSRIQDNEFDIVKMQAEMSRMKKELDALKEKVTKLQEEIKSLSY